MSEIIERKVFSVDTDSFKNQIRAEINCLYAPYETETRINAEGLIQIDCFDKPFGSFYSKDTHFNPSDLKQGEEYDFAVGTMRRRVRFLNCIRYYARRNETKTLMMNFKIIE